MKKLIQISICLMILILNMHTVKAMNYQAQIQDHYYESFQEAIKDILDEKQKGPIYLLDDVILDIGTINKDIEIIGIIIKYQFPVKVKQMIVKVKDV